MRKMFRQRMFWAKNYPVNFTPWRTPTKNILTKNSSGTIFQEVKNYAEYVLKWINTILRTFFMQTFHNYILNWKLKTRKINKTIAGHFRFWKFGTHPSSNKFTQYKLFDHFCGNKGNGNRSPSMIENNESFCHHLHIRVEWSKK
jgi:hypothetical protein